MLLPGPHWLCRVASSAWRRPPTRLRPQLLSLCTSQLCLDNAYRLRAFGTAVSAHRASATASATGPPSAPSAPSLSPNVVNAASPPPARACIVGSGPAGMYTAKYLLKEYPNLLLDIFEQLPVPFGLVRFGVAPDHPEVKVVQHDFQQTMDDRRVRFFGNVTVGSPSLPLSTLLSSYHATILAYGASSCRRVNVPGSHLRGISSARSFVDWYNGHPIAANDSVEVRGPNVVVVGQGNVAIDCARLLLKARPGMQHTDVANHTLLAMDSAGWKDVTRVTLIGRRGPVQAAFTTAEFREVATLDGVRIELRDEELAVGEAAPSQAEMADNRPKKRKYALLREVHQQQREASTPPARSIAFRFLLAPVEYVEDPAHPGWVGGVRCQRMALVPSPTSPTATVAQQTEAYETLPANLVLESIGYMSVPLPELPFDDAKAVVPSLLGRVLQRPPPSNGEAPAVVPGLFVSGWLKRGPTGIIGSNIADARETVGSVVGELKKGEEARQERSGVAVEALTGAAGGAVVDKEGWRKIDEWERKQGEEQGRGRVKLVDVKEMINIASGRL